MERKETVLHCLFYQVKRMEYFYKYTHKGKNRWIPLLRM